MNENKSPWFDGIVGAPARALIESNERLIRVVAGPGAGKTTCLKRRTRRLLEARGIEPAAVFVGTFTRAIARELSEELGEAIGVSTLHSLACRLLREHPAACQGMKLRFLLSYEEASMLYDISDYVPGVPDQTSRKAELLRLQSDRSQRHEYGDAVFAGAIRAWLQRHGGMLVGEVVYLSTTALQSGDIPNGIFDHVVVDEYQDLTAAEQELVELVWSGQGSLVVMGDNNQSIYGFRFNHPDGIDEFASRWEGEGAVDLTFAENRRCGDEILQVANLMMAESGGGGAEMVAASGRVGKVDLVHWSSIDEEVAGLAEYIARHNEESFLVLVPRRFIGYRLRDAIGEEARTVFQEDILRHPIAEESFALASALADLEDGVAVRSWLSLHSRNSGTGPERNSVAYRSLPTGLAPAQLIANIADGTTAVAGVGQSHLRARAKMLQGHVDAGRAGELSVLDLVFDPAKAAQEEDPEKRRWVESDLKDLRDAARFVLRNMEVFSSHEPSSEPPSLAAVMDVLRYRIATRVPLQPDAEEPRVQIMTLHSAKGLECDNVVIAGASDEIVPGYSTEEVAAEQRRLLYVAVTRAKDHLVVSWSRAAGYTDARGNRIRLGQMFTHNGQLLTRLSRTTLLPQALPGGMAGPQWLSEGA